MVGYRNGFWYVYMCTVSGEELYSILSIANFSASVTIGCVPLSVTFTDLSQNATSRSRDVNSDGIEDSNESSLFMSILLQEITQLN
jgi:PKD repeat protein